MNLIKSVKIKMGKGSNRKLLKGLLMVSVQLYTPVAPEV